MEQTNKLWTKEFILLSVSNFFITLTFFLLIVTIGAYAVEAFHASASMAGLVASIFIVGALVGRLLAGNLMLKLGNRRMLLLGLVLFFVSTILYLFVTNVTWLLLNRAFHGITLGIASTALGTIIVQAIPAQRKGEGIGYYSLSAILATAIGPFVGLLLTQYTSFDVVFFVIIGCSLSCLLLFFFTNIEDHVPGGEKRRFSFNQYIEKAAIPISFVALLIGFAYSGVLSFLTFYIEEKEIVQAGNYFFIVYAAIVLLTRPFTGKLFDQRGANIVMYPCFIIFAGGMLLFSVAHNGYMLLLAAVLMGIGYGNFNSVAQAIAVKVTAPARLALATSTYFMFFDIGLGFGPYILGFFIASLGYAGIYKWMVVVIIVALIVYYAVYGRYEQRSQQL